MWGSKAALARVEVGTREGENKRLCIWLDLEPLKDRLEAQLDDASLELKALDYWVEAQGWKWDILEQLLPATRIAWLA